MGYGSLFATVICLYLVPLCYMALEDVMEAFGRVWRRIYPVVKADMSAPAYAASGEA
jgi:hypothetical protein